MRIKHLSLISILLCALNAHADGVVLYDKATGVLQERFAQQVTTQDVEYTTMVNVEKEVVSTNTEYTIVETEVTTTNLELVVIDDIEVEQEVVRVEIVPVTNTLITVSTNMVTVSTPRIDIVQEVKTNQLLVFAKLQPKATIASGHRILGAQILKHVDWSVYDLASFETILNDPPMTTNDLQQVVSFNVLVANTESEQESISKQTIKAEKEATLLAIAEQYGITNRPLDWVVMQQVAIGMAMQARAVQATNFQVGTIMRQDASDLHQLVSDSLQFYVFNNGDPRRVGKNKGVK